jgi:hypothetical protein
MEMLESREFRRLGRYEVGTVRSWEGEKMRMWETKRLGCREDIMIEYMIDIDLVIPAKADIRPLN